MKIAIEALNRHDIDSNDDTTTTFLMDRVLAANLIPFENNPTWLSKEVFGILTSFSVAEQAKPLIKQLSKTLSRNAPTPRLWFLCMARSNSISWSLKASGYQRFLLSTRQSILHRALVFQAICSTKMMLRELNW